MCKCPLNTSISNVKNFQIFQHLTSLKENESSFDISFNVKFLIMAIVIPVKRLNPNALSVTKKIKRFQRVTNEQSF